MLWILEPDAPRAGERGEKQAFSAEQNVAKAADHLDVEADAPRTCRQDPRAPRAALSR
jgi:hypothetical protein